MAEFERINTHLAPLSKGYSDAFDLTDDIALLDAQRLMITTDTIVEGIHYIGDEPADLIARKLMRCNLSDLAAKGATPLYYTLNLTLGDQQDDTWFALFCQGLREDQNHFGLTLIGGDSTTTNHGPAVLSMTAFGALPDHIEPPKRSDAQVGDVVCVSGTIGDAGIGLTLAQKQFSLDDNHAASYLLNRYQLPEPRIALGQSLAPLVHASMDVSDGLMRDALHISNYSGVGIEIHASDIPLSTHVNSLLEGGHIHIEDIVTGGDDYEILCCLPPKNVAKAKQIASSLGSQITAIGAVFNGRGVSLLDANGNAMELKTLGFIHK